MKLANNVSILMVTWNSSSVIGEALKCIANQTCPPEKVLIIDNNSGDVPDLHSLVSNYSFCELIELQHNIGFAAANNMGIRLLSNYEFIALLNPDAYPKNNWLEKITHAAEHHSDYGFFASRQLQPGEQLMDGAGDQLTFAGRPFRRGYGDTAESKYHTDTPIFSACAAAALYRTKALIEAGGFDESFFCYVEDVDLGFRLQLLGYKCLYVASAEVIHIGSTTLGKRSDFSIYHGQRNIVACFFKNMPINLLIVFLIPHLLLAFIYIIASFCIGKKTLVLKAKIAAAFLMKKTLAERKKIQNKRKVSSFYILKILSFNKF